MKVVWKLSALEANACWALDRETKLFPSAKAQPTIREREERISSCVINALNTWNNFLRTYFVCCSLGTKSPSGKKIHSNITNIVLTPRDAIGKAVLNFKPYAAPRANGEWDSRDEPKWHDSGVILTLAKQFSFSNEADIYQAFSYGFTAHRNLVVFRNYYAHKNRITKEKTGAIAIQYLIPGNLHPSDALFSPPKASPSSTLFEMWVEELKQTAGLLCS